MCAWKSGRPVDILRKENTPSLDAPCGAGRAIYLHRTRNYAAAPRTAASTTLPPPRSVTIIVGPNAHV